MPELVVKLEQLSRAPGQSVLWSGAGSSVNVKEKVFRLVHSEHAIWIDSSLPHFATLEERSERLVLGLGFDSETARRKPWERRGIRIVEEQTQDMNRNVVFTLSQVRTNVNVIVEPQLSISLDWAECNLLTIHIEFVLGVGRDLDDQVAWWLAV
jgi:hypothetical protein